MTSKPDEMEAEADAILRVLELAEGNRASKSAAQMYAPKVKSGAARLRDGARVLRERERVAG
jgi:hypothetical protein